MVSGDVPPEDDLSWVVWEYRYSVAVHLTGRTSYRQLSNGQIVEATLMAPRRVLGGLNFVSGRRISTTSLCGGNAVGRSTVADCTSSLTFSEIYRDWMVGPRRFHVRLRMWNAQACQSSSRVASKIVEMRVQLMKSHRVICNLNLSVS